MITIEDLSKIELKVGTVLEAEDIEGSEKLLKLWYKPEDLKGKQIIVVANLEPGMMMGLESQGMMLGKCLQV